ATSHSSRSRSGYSPTPFLLSGRTDAPNGGSGVSETGVKETVDGDPGRAVRHPTGLGVQEDPAVGAHPRSSLRSSRRTLALLGGPISRWERRVHPTPGGCRRGGGGKGSVPVGGRSS